MSKNRTLFAILAIAAVTMLAFKNAKKINELVDASPTMSGAVVMDDATVQVEPANIPAPSPVPMPIVPVVRQEQAVAQLVSLDTKPLSRPAESVRTAALPLLRNRSGGCADGSCAVSGAHGAGTANACADGNCGGRERFKLFGRRRGR